MLDNLIFPYEDDKNFVNISRRIGKMISWLSFTNLIIFVFSFLYILASFVTGTEAPYYWQTTFGLWMWVNLIKFLFDFFVILFINKLEKTKNYDDESIQSLRNKIITESKKLKKLFILSIVSRIIPLLPFIFDFLIWRFWYFVFRKSIFSEKAKELTTINYDLLNEESKMVLDKAEKIMKILNKVCLINVFIFLSIPVIIFWKVELWDKSSSGILSLKTFWIIPFIILCIPMFCFSFLKSIDLMDLINKLANVETENIENSDVKEIISKSKQIKNIMKWRFLTNLNAISFFTFLPDTFVIFSIYREAGFFRKQRENQINV